MVNIRRTQKLATIIFNLDSELKEKIRQKAIDNGLDLSGYCRLILIQHLKQEAVITN